MSSDRDKISLSIFFPCFNEEDNVEKMTEKCLSAAKQITDDFEVIIVNDGSSDRTAEIACQLCDKYPQVKLVDHKKNKGYGAALQSGFKACTKDFIFYTDGDSQFDVGELPKLFDCIDSCDIVSCYRIKRQDNFMRKLNALCWTTLVGTLFKMKIRDIDCAFKLYRRAAIDNIKMTSTGALIDTEILARATKKGYRIKQIGVKHYPRTAGNQTGAKISVILKAFKELFALYRQIQN